MYPEISPLVCLRCTSSFCSKRLLDKHLRITGHFVPSERKLLDGYIPARAAHRTRERDPPGQGQTPMAIVDVMPFFNFSNKIRAEVEEGEITQKEQGEEFGRRKRREMELRKERERRQREEEAKIWKMNIKGRTIGEEEKRVGGLKSLRRDSDADEQNSGKITDCCISKARKLRPRLMESYNPISLSIKDDRKIRARDFRHNNRDFAQTDPAPISSNLVGVDQLLIGQKPGLAQKRNGSNIDHADISGYYEPRYFLDREHAWDSQKHSRSSYQRLVSPTRAHKNEPSTRSKFCGSKIFEQTASKDPHELDIQAKRAKSVSVGDLSAELPVKKPARRWRVNRPVLEHPNSFDELLDDRDDVGEWRAEIHDVQYYYFV